MSDPNRRLAGAMGAHLSWANTTDRAGRTAPARAAMEAKFLAQADGDPVRAAHLRKAYYQGLALKSVAARRARRSARLSSAERAAERAAENRRKAIELQQARTELEAAERAS